MRALVLLCIALLPMIGVHAESLEVRLDFDAAREVIAAVGNPQLTRDEALRIAHLPGNQGLLQKIRSYGRPADEDHFAQALLAAARQEPDAPFSDYGFAKVRVAAPALRETLESLAGPSAKSMDQIKRRVGQFTPASLTGRVTGYAIVGGSSGGFSFGKTDFYLNLARYAAPPLAATVMEHELYHAIQGLARTHDPAGADMPPRRKACLQRLPGGVEMAELFESLYDEGTATYVGDVLLLSHEADANTRRDIDHLERNIRWVERSVTLLELAVHGLATGTKASYDAIYALGFYNDEILYALGYVMAKHIVAHNGAGALSVLLTQAPAEFVKAYVALQKEGKDGANGPTLGAATVEWANKVASCGP